MNSLLGFLPGPDMGEIVILAIIGVLLLGRKLPNMGRWLGLWLGRYLAKRRGDDDFKGGGGLAA